MKKVGRMVRKIIIILEFDAKMTVVIFLDLLCDLKVHKEMKYINAY